MKLLGMLFKATLGTVIALALLEGAVRLTGLASFQRLHPTVLKARQAMSELLLEPDEELLFRLQRGVRAREPELGFYYETNAQGLRTHGAQAELLVAKPRGVARILCLGDSCTFGMRVDRDETYVARLEARLRAQGKQVEVWNLGVPGYSSANGVRLAQQLAVLAPDVVTIAYGFNDSLLVTSSAEADFALLAHRRWLARARRLVMHSAFYQWLVHALGEEPQDHDAAEPVKGRVVRVSAPRYEANLRRIVELVRACGARPLLIDLDLPNRFCQRPLERIARDTDTPLLETREVFDEAKGNRFGFVGDPAIPNGMARVEVHANLVKAPYLMGMPSDRSLITPTLMPLKPDGPNHFSLEFPLDVEGYEITIFDGERAGGGVVPDGLTMRTILFNYFVSVPHAKQQGVRFAPDGVPPWPYTGLLAGDPIHPNARGQELIARALVPLVAGCLEQ
jgi:lysophospholipase L1-like esterase